MIIKSSILIAEDFSAVGRLSATAALAILSAFGSQTATLPTEILSTQTEGFGQPATLTTDSFLSRATGHWNGLDDLIFKSAIVGYVGKSSTADLLYDYCSKSDLTTLLIDPVLGDRGQMYEGFDDAYLASIKHLVEIATLMTPNITELSLLSGEKLASDADDDRLVHAIKKCQEKTQSKARVIVTGVLRDEGIGCVYMRDGQLKWVGSKWLHGHFYGTGDVFSALLIGYLNLNLDFDMAIQKSIDGVYEAVRLTSKAPAIQHKFGLNLTKTLYDVAKFTLGQAGEEV